MGWAGLPVSPSQLGGLPVAPAVGGITAQPAWPQARGLGRWYL